MLRPPFLGPRRPVYPPLRQMVRVHSPGIPISQGTIQQYNGLVLGDREDCYIWEPNGAVLDRGYYKGRLVGSYLGRPLIVCSMACCHTGSSSESGFPFGSGSESASASASQSPSMSASGSESASESASASASASGSESGSESPSTSGSESGSFSPPPKIICFDEEISSVITAVLIGFSAGPGGPCISPNAFTDDWPGMPIPLVWDGFSSWVSVPMTVIWGMVTFDNIIVHVDCGVGLPLTVEGSLINDGGTVTSVAFNPFEAGYIGINFATECNVAGSTADWEVFE